MELGKYDIVASIVLYKNDRMLLQKAIGSFLNTKLNVLLQLVDNSPTNALQDITSDPRARYIFNNANLGFGRAHNISLRQGDALAKYHLVLNPDIMFPEGTLESLYAFMEATPEAGLVMPKVLDFDGEMQFLCKRLPTPADLLVRRFLFRIFPQWFERKMIRYQMLEKDYNTIFEAPSLSGCFMLLRAEALKKAGLFDERFFMYMEDIDITRRVHQYFKTFYYPGVHIYHGHARESYRINRLLFTHIASAIRYFNKWGWFFDAERKEVNRHL